MIRLGVDAWNLPGDRRGIGRYVRALLDQWSAHFADRIQPTLIVPEWHTWTVARRYNSAAGAFGRYPVRSRLHHDRAGLDLLWFPFNGPSWARFSLPSVATLHDASTFVLPGFREEARATFHLAAQRCNHIITDSDFSKVELQRELRLPAQKLTRVYPGVKALPPGREAIHSSRFDRFALFVGECETRKGFDTLEEALTILREKGLTIPVVVAGEPRDLKPLEALTVHVLGHVGDRELAQLYRDCAVFVYPSRYEGFGLPVLEAMSFGAPVIASSAAAIPEAGGEAAIYFAAGDAARLASLLERVWTDDELAADLQARGLARAQTMTWHKTAAATIGVFESVARG